MRALLCPMDINIGTSYDLEQMVRVRRAWWRLYVTELIRLVLGRKAWRLVTPARELDALIVKREQENRQRKDQYRDEYADTVLPFDG